MIAKGEELRREHVQHDPRARYRLPVGGWLEELELRPLIDCPNLDAGAPPYELAVELRAPNGQAVPLDVVIVSRVAVA